MAAPRAWLADHDDIHVTLIDRNNYHRYQPVLYQAATRSTSTKRDGCVIGVASARGDVLWSGPFPPYLLENVGHAELRVIRVEIKRES